MLASDGDNWVLVPRPTFAKMSCNSWPVARPKIRLREADHLAATLDEDIGGIHLLGLVPGSAFEGNVRLVDYPDARVVELRGRRSGCSRGSRYVALADNAAGLLRKCRSAFLFVQVHRPLGGGFRARGVTRGAQHSRQCQTGVAVINQAVRALGQADCGLGDPPSLVVITAARQQLRPNRAPRDRRLQRVTGETLTLRTQFVGLGISVERQTCTGQAARRSRRYRRRDPSDESRCRPDADAARPQQDRRRPARRCRRTARPRGVHDASQAR